MKVGLRTPSLKRSVKARTTGRMKRAAKRAINPIYGKKMTGYLKDPERAVKNKIYHKLTVDPLNPIKNHHADIDIPITERHQVKFRKYKTWEWMMFPLCIAVLYTCYMVIFNHQLHLRWVLISAILGIITIILKIVEKHRED